MATRRLMTGYGISMAALIAAFYFLYDPDKPTWHTILWAVIGVTSAAAVLIGVYIHRPRRMSAWVLLAGGVLALTAGDVTYYIIELETPDPFPSWADAIYLLGFFPLLAAGLLSLARSGSAHKDRASLVDALTLTAGVGLLSWIFLIEPQIKDPDLSPVEKLIAVAYPLYDVLILALIVQMIASFRRTTSTIFLVVGGVGLLVADVLYGYQQLNGTFENGGITDLGWAVFYLFWGLAALHPSMKSLTMPRVTRESQVTGARLAVLTLAALIAPAVLFVEEWIGTVEDGHAIAIMSALIFFLVLVRLAGVVAGHRNAVARERGLREAGAALVSANHPLDVENAVREAIRKLLPAGTDHRVVLDAQGRDDEWAQAAPISAASTGTDRTYFVRTRDLGVDTAMSLDGFELTLVRRLALDDRPTGDPLLGALLVAAEDRPLVALSGAVDVLASQAALALERISLSNEIVRRNSEEYFRTLVHNTADVILILNDDNRIRYASPSAETVFGTVSSPGDRSGRSCTPRIGSSRGRSSSWCGPATTAPESRTGPCSVPTVGSFRSRCPAATSAQTRRSGGSSSRSGTSPSGDGWNASSPTGPSTTRSPVWPTGSCSTSGSNTRSRGRGGAARWSACCSSIWTTSRWSTTHSGTRSAISCSTRSGSDCPGVLRSNDTAARLGGDEFAVLIEDARDPEDVEQVADRIVASARPSRSCSAAASSTGPRASACRRPSRPPTGGI